MNITAKRVLCITPWILFGVLALFAAPDFLRRAVCDAECQAQSLILTSSFRELRAASIKAAQAGELERGVPIVQPSLDMLSQDKIGIFIVTRPGEVVLTSSFGKVAMLARQEMREGKIQWRCSFFQRDSQVAPMPRTCSDAYPHGKVN